MTDLPPKLLGDAPGFAAFTTEEPYVAGLLAERVRAVRRGLTIDLDQRTAAVVWGLPEGHGVPWQVVLGATARTDRGELSAADVRRLLGGGDAAALLAEVVPPFAAAGWCPERGSIAVVVDWLGFRHLYLAKGPGWSGVSSSAATLGGCVGRGIDRTALLVQSQLGWQVGERTLHAGVRKVAAGTRAELRAGEINEIAVVRSDADADPLLGQRPEQRAFGMVADVVARFLDDHDDALLQLTGGLDSRILLGAIPRSRRPDVEALTLAMPGSPDARIAARLAAAAGMRHRIIDLEGLAGLAPADAYALVRAASRRVEGAADPLALASILWAERELTGRARLGGLGGEVASGFYYFGPSVRVRVRRQLSFGLARWRMFPNEAVEVQALRPDLDEVAAEVAAAEVHEELAAAHEWWPATDEFYLWQRMQRWAGTLASATAYDRSTVNPMLSRRFVDLARCLPPAEKRTMRYLSRILVEGDPSLAGIELDGRPAPRTYAEATRANSWRLGLLQARKVLGKVRQRASGTTRPPVGGEVLTAHVLAHWRRDSSDLSRLVGVFQPTWLDRVAAGAATPAPATVALMVNLGEAMRAAEVRASGSVSGDARGRA